MLEYLKALARRLLGGEYPRLPPGWLPGDPNAGVREPRHRRPGGRGMTEAVPEPDEYPLASAIGAERTPRH